MAKVDDLSDKINRIRLWTVTANVQSTNVKRMKYDSIMKELVIEFWGDGTYTYSNVSEQIYNDIRSGNASTKGAGDWGPEGTTPSVGAAVHRYLIENGNKGTKGGTI
jgi:hypothetical protein